MATLSPMITLLFFSLLSSCLIPSHGEQHPARPAGIHSRHECPHMSIASSRRVLQQAPSPEDVHGNIQQVCSATRYSLTCLDALQSDNRSQTTDLVQLLTTIAMERSQIGLADAETLSNLAFTLSNDTFTATSSGCTETLSLANHNLQISQNSVLSGVINPDVQVWLSGALTQANDCYYALQPFRNLDVQFVVDMTDRGNVTVEIISCALAVVDAWLWYGNDSRLWKKPPESREEQLNRLDRGVENYTEIFGNRVEKDARSRDDRAWASSDQLDWNVTVALDSAMASVQDAVDQAPSWSSTRYVIYIRAGVYNETVRIPKEKTNLMFFGDGSNVTVITGNLHVQSPGVTTWLSATVGVSGAGFVARGITFENTAGPEQHQAVALRVEADRSAFHSCSILGHQDSLYSHSLRQFFKACTIAGTVDFIFGNSAAVFQGCTIVVRPRDGALKERKSSTSTLTAQGRIDPAQSTGLVFQNCTVTGSPDFAALQQSSPPGFHRVYLGRPWKLFSRTIFLRTQFDLTLQPQGWMPWNGTFALETLLDGEYGSSGPGGVAAKNLSELRVEWSSQLSLEEAEWFSVSRFLGGDAWLPQTGVPYEPLA